jgi:hypothetical protein
MDDLALNVKRQGEGGTRALDIVNIAYIWSIFKC